MATVLKEWAKEEVRSVPVFDGEKKVPPVEIHRELVTVYGARRKSIVTIVTQNSYYYLAR
jgi:hypothetical protein